MAHEEAEPIVQALKARAQFDLIDIESSDSRIRLVGRVITPPGLKNDSWTMLIAHLLQCMAKADWKVDISRQYFLRQLDTGPKLFYAWRLIFQGQELKKYVPQIVAAIQNAPLPSRVELTEKALAGATKNRNDGADYRKRGARTIAAAPGERLCRT